MPLTNADPGLRLDGEDRIELLRPGPPTVEMEEYRPLLTGPGRQPASVSGREGTKGAETDHIHHLDQRCDHRRLVYRSRRFDQDHALQRDTEFVAGHQTQLLHPDAGSPAIATEGRPQKGHGQGPAPDPGHPDRPTLLQAPTGKQRDQRLRHRHQPLARGGDRSHPLLQVGEQATSRTARGRSHPPRLSNKCSKEPNLVVTRASLRGEARSVG